MSTRSWFRLKFPHKGGQHFLEDIKTAIRNDFISTPPFFEAMCKHPPIFFFGRTGKKIENIVYPEDKLRKTLFSLKPELLEYPHRDNFYDNRWYRHPADQFVFKQLKFIEQGMSEEEAFKKVDRELDEEKAIRMIELEVAKQHAEQFGIPNRSKEVLHQNVLTYKQAAARWREGEKRSIREKIEQVILFRSSNSKNQPIRPEDIGGVTPHDITDYLRIYPENAKYFAEEFRFISVDEDENYLEDEFEDQFDIEQNDIILDEPTHENIFETKKVDTTSDKEIQAFDREENPIAERDLDSFLKSLNVDPRSYEDEEPEENPLPHDEMDTRPILPEYLEKETEELKKRTYRGRSNEDLIDPSKFGNLFSEKLANRNVEGNLIEKTSRKDLEDPFLR